jgi:thiamine transport system ATP-binding protein
MTEVRLERVTKRFGGTVAVKEVSFTAFEGGFLALVGPSGCGKTTTLRLIAGFEQPDSGDILFDGRGILGKPPEARHVGMVFQNYALFPHMSVEANIAYGLRSRHRAARKERVSELLRLVDLEGLQRRDPTELSSGQRQRAALARALAPVPKLLLLDEPLSALDAKLRERLRLEIRQLQRQVGVTTIYVTHDQEEALAISDRIAVISRGRIEQLGEPYDIYNRPTTEFVASFIGHGNLLPGVITRVGEGKIKARLATGGPEITLEAAEGYHVGQRIKLLVRPERIRLDGSFANRLRGQLRGVEFLGDALWAYLNCSGSELRVKLPPLNPRLEEGQEIELSFSSEDCHIIPTSDPLT